MKGNEKMIATNINDVMVESYSKVHPRFEVAFEALKKFAFGNYEVGKYEVDGKNVFVMVQEYETKPAAEKKFEIHKDYIDIQYIISGEELMGYESLDKLTPMNEYKPDVQHFFMNEEYDKITVRAGELVIFFPNEPHAPGAAVNDNPSAVRKIVVKILA